MATLTIQPSDIDTFLDQLSPNSNRGTYNYISVQSDATNLARSVLKFDFSALPAGATISAATLSLYAYNAGSAGRTYWTYELTQTDWVETEATWNSYKTGSAWAAAGGDYTTTDGASAVVPSDDNWMNWNVLTLVQHFQSAHAEVAHFLIRDNVEGSGGGFCLFYSRKYPTDTSLRPKLVVTYTAAQHYTLTAEAGSYTMAGQDASLRSALKIAAGAGSYSLTGQDASLRFGRKIAAGAGSYSLTGQDAVLRAIRRIAAEGGSYALTGYDANLLIGHHYVLTAEQGYYGEPYSKIFVTLDGRIYKKMGDTYLRLG